MSISATQARSEIQFPIVSSKSEKIQNSILIKKVNDIALTTKEKWQYIVYRALEIKKCRILTLADGITQIFDHTKNKIVEIQHDEPMDGDYLSLKGKLFGVIFGSSWFTKFVIVKDHPISLEDGVRKGVLIYEELAGLVSEKKGNYFLVDLDTNLYRDSL